MIPDYLVQRLWGIAMSNAPRESCGILVGDDSGFIANNAYFDVRELRNYAPDPTKEFWMNPKEVELYTLDAIFGRTDTLPLGRYHVATWHSHPDGLWNLSALDRQLMIKSQLPMAVVAPKPYPAVALYVVQEGQIVCAARYRVQEVVCSKNC
jgi:proteasome lid subunit RPN8/RPN11